MSIGQGVFSGAAPPKVPLPILIRTTLTTVLHYRADCDVAIPGYGLSVQVVGVQALWAKNPEHQWYGALQKLLVLHGAIYEERRPNVASKYSVKPLRSLPSHQSLHLPHNMQTHHLAEPSTAMMIAIRAPPTHTDFLAPGRCSGSDLVGP